MIAFVFRGSYIFKTIEQEDLQLYGNNREKGVVTWLKKKFMSPY